MSSGGIIFLQIFQICMERKISFPVHIFDSDNNEVWHSELHIKKLLKSYLMQEILIHATV